MRFIHLIASVTLAGTLMAGETVTWTAETLFEKSIADGLSLSPDSGAIELQRGVLYEDDGPAAGYSYKPNDESLKPGTWIKKTLLIPNPQSHTATLFLGSSDSFEANINGMPVTLKKSDRISKHWKNYTFDPAVLKSGANEIVLSGAGKIWIARDDEYALGSTTRTRHPNRSAKSSDEGKSWNDTKLGARGDLDGEYCIRVFLDQHRSSGRLVLPAVDLGNLAAGPLGPVLKSPGSVRLKAANECPAGTELKISVRSGNAYVPGADWSGWLPVNDAASLTVSGRFMQVAVDFSTADPLKTPRLKSLTIESNADVDAGSIQKLKVLDSRNAPLVRSAIPFTYEPYDHPALKCLREQYQLDAVVQDSKSEFELILNLAAWTAGRWQKMHLSESYPAWNALDILSTHKDGTPVGGFCQQYSVVFLQACESFGIPGRIVSINQGPNGGPGDKIKGSGHEVTEIWSNEFRKWIYVDANMAWYAADAETKTPLSLLELQERQLLALNGEKYRQIAISHLRDSSTHAWKGLTEWPAFLELRLIPRSNFLEAPAPLPLNQGMRGWFWSGHVLWEGQTKKTATLYDSRTSRRGDFEWSLNTVHLTFETLAATGELRVHADTNTPGLESIIARIDNGEPRSVTFPFTWKLHSGRNRLEVFARNKAGRTGSPSFIVIESP